MRLSACPLHLPELWLWDRQWYGGGNGDDSSQAQGQQSNSEITGVATERAPSVCDVHVFPEMPTILGRQFCLLLQE